MESREIALPNMRMFDQTIRVSEQNTKNERLKCNTRNLIKRRIVNKPMSMEWESSFQHYQKNKTTKNWQHLKITQYEQIFVTTTQQRNTQTNIQGIDISSRDGHDRSIGDVETEQFHASVV